MANLTPTLLYIGNGSDSNVYTTSSSTGSYTILRNINFCNSNSSPTTCNVHILSSSGTPGANNALMYNFTLAGNETISYDASVILGAGYKIYIKQAATYVTYTMSGVVYSA